MNLGTLPGVSENPGVGLIGVLLQRLAERLSVCASVCAYTCTSVCLCPRGGSSRVGVRGVCSSIQDLGMEGNG